MSALAQYPSLQVELGAAFVLAAALLARVLSRRFGVPSIVTLLACGMAAGPSGMNFVRLDLTNPATRALLSLAVVIVLFEATLRIDFKGISKVTIAILGVVGSALTLWLLPAVGHAYGLTPLIGSMIAAICVVTGPTVIGPLMARLRPRPALGHLLETEGLVLDALGVIIAAAAFASFTSRPAGAVDAAWHAAARIGAGIAVGLLWGFAGRGTMNWVARASSDISKIYVLLIGFSAYAVAEWLAHESGLVAVVVCGLLLDFRILPHERLLRVFKEDLSMLALSTVFVLLASQIEVQKLAPLLPVAAAIVGVLVAFRIVSVIAATFRSGFNFGERLLMCTVFPRGIVAVSLATYYATQIPAWGLHGGTQLAGIMFLIVCLTIVISTPAAMIAARAFNLQMPALIIAGITPATLDTARRYLERGHLPLMVDSDDDAIAFARSHDLEAQYVEGPRGLPHVVRERNAKFVIVEGSGRWAGALRQPLGGAVTVLRSGSDAETHLLGGRH